MRRTAALPILSSLWLPSTVSFVLLPIPQRQYHTCANIPFAAIADTNEATLRSVTFSNIPKAKEPGLFCDFLLELGACSTSIIDSHKDDPLLEVPLFGDDTAWHDTLHWAAPVWDTCNVTAHFPDSVNIPNIIQMVRDTLDDEDDDHDNTVPNSLTHQYSIEQVPNKDWVVHVQQSWSPIVVADKFLLTFPWHNETTLLATTTTSANQTLLPLKLQGGIAFGTGEHATTQLCLQWLSEVVEDLLLQNTNRDCILDVLDYGCGSGILGMGACKLSNDRVRATGIDIDVDAIRIANANARLNTVNMQNYLPPTTLQLSNHDHASNALLLKAHSYARKQLETKEEEETLILDSDTHHVYDICVANILAGPLIALAPTLHAMLRPGGSWIGMSGILKAQGDTVVKAYQEAGFSNVQVREEKDGWVLVTGRRT